MNTRTAIFISGIIPITGIAWFNHRKNKNKNEIYERSLSYIKRKLNYQMYNIPEITDCVMAIVPRNTGCKQLIQQHLSEIKSTLERYKHRLEKVEDKQYLNVIYKKVLLERLETYKKFGVEDNKPHLEELLNSVTKEV